MKRVASAFIAIAAFCSPASALTLTPDGTADGFTLSVFLNGYPSAQYGPLSQGIAEWKRFNRQPTYRF